MPYLLKCVMDLFKYVSMLKYTFNVMTDTPVALGNILMLNDGAVLP